MKKVLLYFKKHLPAIILLVAMLTVQVKCQLLLPEYTSDIVNVGIQQDGIGSPVPKIVDEFTYTRMLSLSNVDDKKIIASAYELWTPDSKSSENRKIKENNPNSDLIEKKYYKNSYYLLKDGAVTKRLETAMSDSLTEYAKYMISNTPSQGGMKNMDFLQDSDVPSFIKTQIGIKMVREIYKNNGINVENIQKLYLWTSGFKMLAIALVGGIFAIIVNLIASKTAAKVAKNIREDTYSKVLDFSNLEMDRFSIASLITRSTNDIQLIQQSSSMVLLFIFLGPLTAIGAIKQVLDLNVSMIWIIVLSVAVTILCIAVIMKHALPKFNRVQKIVDKLNLVTREIISGIEVNRVFGTKKYEEKRFDDVNRELTGTVLFVNRMVSLMNPLMMLVMNITTLLILWFGAKKIEIGALQVGNMMAFMQYAILIIMAFLFISMVSVILPRSIVSANRIAEILDTEVTVKDSGKVDDFRVSGKLEFRDVSFRYDGAEDYVLSNISFKVTKGKTLAIIGSTGSGKSTLVNLIPRFMDATSGSILLDNVDIKDIKLETLRYKVAYVSQTPVVFSGTFKSNIEYGNGIQSVTRMMKAAQISQSMEFIEKKEAGFDSQISQNGSNLSGGQKQRIAIARALSRDSEIIIFDDSFSALDLKTDRNLRAAIRQNLKDKTMIIVAQRINTIINADEILVLDNGKIVGRGTHSQLLESCDVYRDIASSQLLEEGPADEK